MSKSSEGWETFFNNEGREIRLLRDEKKGVLHIRREDGAGATLTLPFFKALCEQFGKICLSCGVGKIDSVDFERLENPTLTCDFCDAEHMVVGERLTLLN